MTMTNEEVTEYLESVEKEIEALQQIMFENKCRISTLEGCGRMDLVESLGEIEIISGDRVRLWDRIEHIESKVEWLKQRMK